MAVAPSASTSAPSAPARRSRRGQRRLVASGSCVPPRNLSPTATCPTPKTVTAIPNRTASTSTLASCQASTSAPTRTFVAPASPWISRSSSRWSAARTSFRIPFARSARPTASVSARTVTPGQASAAQPPASQTIPARRESQGRVSFPAAVSSPTPARTSAAAVSHESTPSERNGSAISVSPRATQASPITATSHHGRCRPSNAFSRVCIGVGGAT